MRSLSKFVRLIAPGLRCPPVRGNPFENLEARALMDAAQWSWTETAAGDRPDFVLSADLDRDGREDVVTGSGSSGGNAGAYVSVMFNLGGSLREPIRYRLNYANGSAAPGQITDLALGDVNNDNFVDIVALVGSGSRIHVLLNDGLGTFRTEVGPSVIVGSGYQSIALGNFTGDSTPDLAVTSAADNSVKVFRNDNTGRIDRDGRFHLAASASIGGTPSDVVVADLDGDGTHDIAATEPANGRVWVIGSVTSNLGVWTLGTPAPFQTGGTPIRIERGDVLGDGKYDLVIVNQPAGVGSSTLVIMENRTALQSFNFRNQPLPSAPPIGVADIEVGDINADGKLDIAAAAGSFIALYRAEGSGSSRNFPLVENLIAPESSGPSAALVRLVDINSYARRDLVCVNGAASPRVWYSRWTTSLNAEPSVGTPLLSSSLGLVGTSITLSASPVDIDGSIVQLVAFDDANGDGTINTGEALLGLDASSDGGWSVTFTVPGTWAVGPRRVLVRVTDNQGAESPLAATTFTVTANAAPTVTSFTASPASIAPGAVVNLSATASDSDGAVTSVRFYYDRTGTWDTADTLIAQDSDGTGGWSGTYLIPATFAPGTYYVYAVATDDEGSTGIASTVLRVTSNSMPAVTSFAAQPADPVIGATITLTAIAADPDPVDAITVVKFYYDSNSSGAFESSDSVLFIDDTPTDGWTASLPVPPEWVGIRRLYAVATDDRGASGAPTSVDISVNTAPVVSSLVASLGSVTEGDAFNLTATASDAEGAVSVVMFYRDLDANGLLDTAVDSLLGTDSNASDGFSVTVPTTGVAFGTYHYLAVAQDTLGSPSSPAAASTLIHPSFGVGTLTPAASSAPRSSSVVFAAGNIFLPEGRTVTRVEFYSDTNRDGVFSRGDKNIGSVTRLTNGTASATLPTKGLPTGGHLVFARIQDNTRAWSQTTAGSVDIVNNNPTIGSLKSTPTLIKNRGDDIRLSVAAAKDLDGRVTTVRYFHDDPTLGVVGQLDNADSFIGEFPLAQKPLVSSDAFAEGQNRFFAVANDNDGGASAPVTTLVTLNAPPNIGSATFNPGTGPRATTMVNFMADGVTDSDGFIKSFDFWYDANGNRTLDARGDRSIGKARLVDGVWMLTVAGNKLPLGTSLIFARATDNIGGFSSYEIGELVTT
ncbi:MAG: FG-GAP-like repeat-containing protein [Phycisphaerales bacterium]